MERAIKRASIEVPALSGEAQQYAQRLSEIKEPAAAKQFIENTPRAEVLAEEIKQFGRTLNKRFGVSSLKEIEGTRQLDLKISGLTPQQVTQKAKPILQLREGLSRVQAFTRSFGLGISR